MSLWWSAILAASNALAGPVSISTADGVTLAAETWGRGTRGVLLVHDEGRTHADWARIAPRLADAGFVVLAPDLRGHGASPPAASAPIAEADWPTLAGDVTAGVAWLVARGATEIHVIGDRVGANLALAGATGDPHVVDLVLVSPVVNAHGLRVSSASSGIGARSVLVVAGEQDAVAIKTGQWIVDQGGSPRRLERVPGGPGERLLNVAPESASLVLGWIDGGAAQLAAAGGAATGPSLKSGSVDDIETTGTRLEDRKR